MRIVRIIEHWASTIDSSLLYLDPTGRTHDILQACRALMWALERVFDRGRTWYRGLLKARGKSVIIEDIIPGKLLLLSIVETSPYLYLSIHHNKKAPTRILAASSPSELQDESQYRISIRDAGVTYDKLVLSRALKSFSMVRISIMKLFEWRSMVPDHLSRKTTNALCTFAIWTLAFPELRQRLLRSFMLF